MGEGDGDLPPLAAESDQPRHRGREARECRGMEECCQSREEQRAGEAEDRAEVMVAVPQLERPYLGRGEVARAGAPGMPKCGVRAVTQTSANTADLPTEIIFGVEEEELF